MSISPTKESIPSLAPRNTLAIHPPPSPHSHRVRRLQSAQNLNTEHTRGTTQPSLIAQQRQQSRNFSPARKDSSAHAQTASSHNRMRSNSDAAIITTQSPALPGKKVAVGKKAVTTDASSLDRLIRDGAQDGDLAVALDSTRLKILDQGIKSDSDGMVCSILLLRLGCHINVSARSRHFESMCGSYC
jgi:cell cycle arrest protein BUB2